MFFNGGQNGFAAILEFAQIDEPLFQIAQLRIIKAARDLFAVASDEGHGGAFVQQLNGGQNLRSFYIQFGGNLFFNDQRHGNTKAKPRPKRRSVCRSGLLGGLGEPEAFAAGLFLNLFQHLLMGLEICRAGGNDFELAEA